MPNLPKKTSKSPPKDSRASAARTDSFDEKSLAENERSFRFFGERIMHQVWTAFSDGNLAYVNQRTLEYFGRASEQMLGAGWQDAVHPEDLPVCVERWSASLRTGDYYEVELRLRRADGEYRWHLARANCERGADGKIIKWFGTTTDIDDQKIAEQALRRNEKQFRSIVETTCEWIWATDAHGNISYSNPAVERILGYRPEEVVGKTLGSFTHEDDRAKIEQKISGFAAEKRGWSNLFSRWRHKNGTVRCLESSAAPVFDENGNLNGFQGSDRDVTERSHADDALRQSEAKFRTLVESTSEGLLQVDDADCIEFVNKRLCEMVGFSEEELLGTDWKRLLLEEAGKDFIQQVNERRRQGISDRYEIRLKSKSGETLWVIVGGAPITDAKGKITGSLGVFTDITERKRAEDQLLHDAFHDGLTGLANRALFMNHLRMTIERGKSRLSNMYAVLFLDFDRFKIINDSLGHAEGDELLKLIARTLETCTRTGDLVARLGGDEFVILLSELAEEGDAEQIAYRIQEILKTPFDLSGNEILMSASIGIALSTAGHAKAEDMLRDADIAMYRAKAKGKAQHQVFDFEMHNHALSQLQFENEVRHALERDEFCIYYQPIYSLDQIKLVGFEALIRWQHPTRGFVSPAEFIPVAEESGLIIRLGRWMVYESCRQLREWQKKSPCAATAALTVAVNLSCKEFLQADLAEQVNASLISTGLDPRCLKLEITESHIMENQTMAVSIMKRLRFLGVELSLDDFGTGYSSLSYLHRLPASYLKIDGSFVSGIMESRENAEIVYTIVKLAQNLKMKVVAEGIETEEQLEHLQRINCEYGQGYLFSKPLAAEKAEALINEQNEYPPSFVNQPVIDLDLNV